MSDQLIKETTQRAEEYFSCAQEELFKPEEDVVNYMVCKCAYRAAYNYLTVYLLNNKVEVHATESLENIVEECKKINPVFNELHLDLLYHPLDEDVWMDLETARKFMDLAEQTKELIESIKP